MAVVNPNLPSKMPPLRTPMLQPQAKTGIQIIDSGLDKLPDFSKVLLAQPWMNWFNLIGQILSGGASSGGGTGGGSTGGSGINASVINNNASVNGSLGSSWTTLVTISLTQAGYYAVTGAVEWYASSIDGGNTATLYDGSVYQNPYIETRPYVNGAFANTAGDNIVFNGTTVTGTSPNPTGNGPSNIITLSGRSVQETDLGQTLFINGGTNFTQGVYYVVGLGSGTWIMNTVVNATGANASGMAGYTIQPNAGVLVTASQTWIYQVVTPPITLSLVAQCAIANGGGSGTIGYQTLTAIGPFAS